MVSHVAEPLLYTCAKRSESKPPLFLNLRRKKQPVLICLVAMQREVAKPITA